MLISYSVLLNIEMINILKYEKEAPNIMPIKISVFAVTLWVH